MMKRFLPLLMLLLALLCVVEAHAVTSPELCGSGVDEPLATGGSANGTKGSCPGGYMDSVWGNGCDLKCSGNDADNDGFTSDGTLGNSGTTYKDCDDNDKRALPNFYVPDSYSSPTGYKKCQTDGTYTSTVLNATTPLCEATGSGVCKYVDCGSGSDSNSGTYASPYATLGKIAGGSAGTTPSSPFTLTAGSVVYVKGTSACTTTMTAAGGLAVLAELTASGTSTDHIQIKLYPGSTATLGNTNGPAFVTSGNYYDFDGLDVSTQRSSALNAGSFINTGSHIHGTRLYIHDMGGHGDNNDACWSCSHNNDCQIAWSYLKDCNKSTGNVDNIVAIKWLDDAGGGSGSTQCQDHSAKFNTVLFSTYSSTNNGMCFKQKHGCLAVDVGANKHEVAYNYCVNPRRGFWWDGSSARIHDNVFITDPEVTVGHLLADGENVAMEDNEVTNNTLKGSGEIRWSPIYYGSTSMHLRLYKNLVEDEKTSYVGGNNEGVLSIDGYGDNTGKTYFEAHDLLYEDYNCYHNANTGVIFSYFAQSGLGAGVGNWTLGQWRSNRSKGLNDVESALSLDAYQQSATVGCTDAGRRLTSTAGAAASSQGMMSEYQ